jgi:methylated-DNA-[protein]-cysteine S-methyltransferase
MRHVPTENVAYRDVDKIISITKQLSLRAFARTLGANYDVFVHEDLSGSEKDSLIEEPRPDSFRLYQTTDKRVRFEATVSTLYTRVESPVGKLLLAGYGGALERLHFSSGPKATRPDPEWVENRPAFREAVRQLELYFEGKLFEFQLDLRPGGTAFQLAVWKALREIPYGQTITYGELARRIRNPGASRAVGLANGANPIAIVIPCHRVIGSDGRLTGFGGGLDVKRKLLALERGELQFDLPAAV